MVLLAVPVGNIAITTGWGYFQRLAWRQEETDAHLSAVANGAAEAVGTLLERLELGAVRALITQVAANSLLDRCTLELADGQVIADSTPGRPTVQDLPQTWPNPSADAEQAQEPGTKRILLAVKGRGKAYLVVAAAENRRWWADKGTVELGAIALGSVLAAAAVYRRAAIVLRPMQAVQGSLLALGAGESSLAALTISPRWGAQATAWNGLISERTALRRSMSEQRGLNRVGSAGSVGSEGTTERACDTLPLGMVLVDGGMKVRYANGAAGTLLRCKRQELLGKPLSDAIDTKEVLDLIAAVVENRSGARRRGTVEVEQSPEGEKSVLRFSVTRMPPEGCGLGMVLIEDMTQQRVADQARDSFVAQATHELRTPLTNIRLYIEMLLEDQGLDPAERGKCINVINQEAGRLERMVGDMLSVAEIEAGSMKLNSDDVRLDTLLEELKADYVAQAAEKQIALEFELPPKMPVIRGDRDKIAMSLHNLIGNALKYTPAGGAIKVKADSSDTSFVVRVEDSGIGISPEETERIFEKFYRAKDRRVAKITGTGLGLALAREVVRMHGGDITVESQLDKGSTFTLRLPALAPAAAKAA